MLTRAEIDDILRLIDGSDFAELRLEMGELKLELRKRGALPPAAVAAPVAAPAAPPAPLAPAAPPAPPAAAAAPAAAPLIAAAPAPGLGPGGAAEVPAPLLGTFWHAPRPGAEPFVKPGDVVAADTVIGIIEVMKLMTSVTAGMAGTVVEILAPNGVLVEHGQPLVRIRPA